MRELSILIPRITAAGIGVLVLSLLAIPAAAQEGQPGPKPPTGFVSVDEVPPGEQIPAINLVAAAYGLVWLALMAYVWSIGRRLRQVETELADLEARRK
jgi:CcmD family protein